MTSIREQILVALTITLGSTSGVTFKKVQS